MKYSGGFECDKGAKQVFKEIATKVFFSACTVIWDAENENDEFAPMDEICTAYTRTGKRGIYAFEIKERKGYNHNDYDEWIMEEHKYNTMQKCKENGITPLYFNLYKDGYYHLWDFDTIERKHTTATIPIKPHTQGDDNEQPTSKRRILINSNDSIRSGKTDEIRDN